ncbi:MAG: hypothetical protein OSA23_16170 [Rhodospirillales bacterium]|nr:hypothetical protein [Rhodospirillales bacterium]
MSRKCQKAFEKGKAKRALYPLEPSTYKLQEAHLGWQRQYDTLKLLESALDNRTEMPADYLLGCWTGADWRGELERLPESLASDVGWRVLPGVLALCAYAGETPESAKLAAGAEKHASNIVRDCENNRHSIAHPTKQRDATIKRVCRAQSLVRTVLMTVEDSFAAVDVPIS